MLTEKRNDFQDINCTERIQRQGETIEVTEELIRKSIQRLKNRRVPGSSGIVPELIKYGSNKLHRKITTLFQPCINGENIPTEWRKSSITPIQKTGQRDRFENYRVSLSQAH